MVDYLVSGTNLRDRDHPLKLNSDENLIIKLASVHEEWLREYMIKLYALGQKMKKNKWLSPKVKYNFERIMAAVIGVRNHYYFNDEHGNDTCYYYTSEQLGVIKCDINRNLRSLFQEAKICVYDSWAVQTRSIKSPVLHSNEISFFEGDDGDEHPLHEKRVNSIGYPHPNFLAQPARYFLVDKNVLVLPVFSVADAFGILLDSVIFGFDSENGSGNHSHLHPKSNADLVKAEKVISLMNVMLGFKHFLSDDIKWKRDLILLRLCDNILQEKVEPSSSKFSTLAVHLMATFYDNVNLTSGNLFELLFMSENYNAVNTPLFDTISLTKLLTLLELINIIKVDDELSYNLIHGALIETNIPIFIKLWIKDVFILHYSLNSSNNNFYNYYHYFPSSALNNLERFMTVLFFLNRSHKSNLFKEDNQSNKGKANEAAVVNKKTEVVKVIEETKGLIPKVEAITSEENLTINYAFRQKFIRIIKHFIEPFKSSHEYIYKALKNIILFNTLEKDFYEKNRPGIFKLFSRASKKVTPFDRSNIIIAYVKGLQTFIKMCINDKNNNNDTQLSICDTLSNLTILLGNKFN